MHLPIYNRMPPHCCAMTRLCQAAEQEAVLQQIGGMDFTIVRPGGLKNETGTGQGVLTENPSVCGAIHREDVADLVIKALFSSKANGKVSLC